MYESFYGLREKPFSILPDPDLIYWGPNHSLALAMLEFGVMNNAGFTVITGEIGSGKTTLLRYLLRRIDPEISVGLISNMMLGKEGLLAWVMMCLNQPYEGTYPQLFQRFQQFLYDEYNQNRYVILIVDEAQTLSANMLEELRMLSNINVDKAQILQVILVGQPQLKDLLRSPELLQFAQRIASDFHLEALKLEEVADYIHFRLTAVGATSQLFSPEACKLIAHASRGVPRTINILCDTALVYGYANNTMNLTGELVQKVIENKARYGVLPLSAY